ncbi:MAG TPA: hypothetical protein VG032_06820 [Acidimicrobiales bacterium]|jgi:hypothetical protein|nr:hypothetical protein [Acidimicrobiales bacterium]
MPGSLWERMRDAMVKPADAADAGPRLTGGEYPTTVPELEAAVKRADDRERMIGLVAAPIAAALGFIISASLVANDPKALLSTGQINKLHVNPSLYVELGAVSVALALVMLATAWFRKRLYLAITMALYGLSLFNLHFWGFGIPYIFAGAWLLVRSYRLQQRLKEARAEAPATGRGSSNKRYTPPTPSGRVTKPKPGRERRAS